MKGGDNMDEESDFSGIDWTKELTFLGKRFPHLKGEELIKVKKEFWRILSIPEMEDKKKARQQ